MRCLGWLYWLAYQSLSIALWPIGLLLVGVASALEMWKLRPSRKPYDDGRICWQWSSWVLFPWSNEEDGVAGGFLPSRVTAFEWCALRNSSNNLRCLPGAFFVCDSATLTFKDYSWGYVATQGWRQCVEWHGIRFGWLIPRTASTGSPAWPVLSLPNGSLT